MRSFISALDTLFVSKVARMQSMHKAMDSASLEIVTSGKNSARATSGESLAMLRIFR